MVTIRSPICGLRHLRSSSYTEHSLFDAYTTLSATEVLLSQDRVWNSLPATIRHSVVVGNTHPLNGPLSGTTRVSRYQKGKTNLDFTGTRDSEWQWQQLGHMQVCTSLQTDNHASTPPLSFFTCRMPFLPPNQQRQSTGCR